MKSITDTLNEVFAGAEVPGLQHGGVAGLLKLHRDPRCR
jgi:hypothetical protein